MQSASDARLSGADGDRSTPDAAAWSALEHERARFAERFFALSQVHSTLEPHEVVAALGQALQQFVGVASFVIYSAEAGSLFPVGAEGIEVESLAVESIAGSSLGVALASTSPWREESSRSGPLCEVPMRIGPETVGLIVVRSLLPQKARLDDEDRALLTLLAMHGAIALAAGRLFVAAGRRIPRWMGVDR